MNFQNVVDRPQSKTRLEIANMRTSLTRMLST